jgi:hypothetical protein
MSFASPRRPQLSFIDERFADVEDGGSDARHVDLLRWR